MTNTKKQIPEDIECAYCGYENAKIFKREGRYYVWCPQCSQEYLLKEYNSINKK